MQAIGPDAEVAVMKMRSLLFVPADSRKKFEKARSCGADLLILDLEDSVAAAHKASARRDLASWIEQEDRERRWSFWVRVNPLDSGMLEADLAAVVRPGLDGIVLPKANGGQDIAAVAAMIEPLEAAAGITPGHIRIIPVATETAAAMFNLGSYAPAHPRLAALTWGAEDLAAVVGATNNRSAGGQWTEPYQLARSLCLFAAANADVPAIDTIHADFHDLQGLIDDCGRSRRDGFIGRLAIHPAQVIGINDAYTPSVEDVELARRVVSEFAKNPDSGAVGIDGRMFDIPHLKQARRTLASIGE